MSEEADRHNPPEVARELISVSQSAREYDVSERTLYRWLKDGRLSRFKGGLGDRKVYADRREVKRLLQPKRVKG